MSRAEEILRAAGKIVEDPAPPITPPAKEPEGGEGGDESEEEEPEPDEVLLAKLKKRGFNINSLQDLNVKPEAEMTDAEKEQFRKTKIAKARSHALQHNLIDEDILNAYDADVEKGETLALELFKNEFLESIAGTDQEGTYTDEDIQEMWDEFNFVDEPEDSVKKKVRKQTISKTVKTHLREKYGKVLEIESAYDNFQSELQQANQYKSVVESAVAKLPKKFQYTINGVSVSYEPTTEAVEQAKAIYLDSRAYKTFGKEATVDGIASAIQQVITSKEFERVLSEVAQSYYSQVVPNEKMGRHGIIERQLTGGEGSPGGNESSTPNADRILNSSGKKEGKRV